MSAREKLTASVKSLDGDMLCEVALGLAGKTAAEEMIVRVAVLSEYETRFGGEAVDLLMDEMEAAL